MRIVEQDLFSLALEPYLVERLASMYLPKRELLSFLVVFAFPKASMIGLLAKICLSVSLRFSDSPLLSPPVRRRETEAGREGSSTEAKYRKMNLADTVFPAPLPLSA